MSASLSIGFLGAELLPGGDVAVTIVSPNGQRVRLDWGDGTVERLTLVGARSRTDTAGDGVDDSWAIRVTRLSDPAHPVQVLPVFIDMADLLGAARNGGAGYALMAGGSGDDARTGSWRS